MSNKKGVSVMYPNNIYIQNHEEIAAIDSAPGKDAAIDVALTAFDDKHGLPYNALLRAQYKHWRSIETGATSLLTAEDRKLLDM